MMETLIRAQRELWNDTIEINFAHRKPTPGVICVAEPLVFKEQQEGLFFEPALRLNTGEAQRLMDELWDCGLRPSEGTGSAGSLRATEKHLTDMQRIAFMLLERPNVEVTGAARLYRAASGGPPGWSPERP
ncbi:MAG: hypothetical protein IPP18_15265 [Rhodocyclaceae bacterium]|nr:hypothetical protein [Rhodocyclaceae bacterium]MBK9311407.1 hypothetical protein [Rhodocyclaceae bacterium]MBK9956437.1 hypothetical protein [Rhodocyclaceae bacterium]